jgi:two-component system response regulator YesN
MSNVKKKRSLLIYNILPYLALLLIFIFVFSWFFQNVLFSALKKEQAENSMISLNEYAYRTDANLRQISAIQDYILQVQDIRYVPNLESIPEAKSIIKTLSMYQIVHSDIEDIFLYFEGDRYVYSSSTTMPIDYFYERVFQSDNPEPVVPQTRQLKENNPPPYLPLYPYTGENKMLLFSPVYIRGVRANLIFYVDLEGWAGLEPDAAYFILDSEGRMISGRNIDPAWDLTNRIDTDKAEATHEIKLGKKEDTYLVGLHQSVDRNWYYGYLSPTGATYDQVLRYQLYFVLLLAAMVLVAFFILGLALKINYRPIRDLVHLATSIRAGLDKTEDDHSLLAAEDQGAIEEIKYALTSLATANESLQKEVQNTKSLRFLQSLLRGSVQDGEVFQKLCRTYRLPALQKNYLAVIVMRLSAVSPDFYDRVLLEDIEKLYQETFEGYLFPLSESYTYCFILGSDKAGSSLSKESLEEVHTILQDRLQCDVLLSVSPTTDNYRDLAKLYLDAYIALEKAFVLGPNALIVDRETADDYDYALANQIFTRLRYNLEKGHLDESMAALDDLRQFIETGSYSLYSIKGLSYQLIQTFNALYQSLYIPHDLMETLPPVQVFMELDSMEEVFDYAEDLAEAICRVLASHKEEEEDILAKEMKAYLEENYQDSNFQVRTMADHFGMSLSNVSQYFKNHNHVNISTYLSEIRMEKAKALLLEKEATVKDVAGQVGYLNTSSFIRKFKSLYGVTPLQYVENAESREE